MASEAQKPLAKMEFLIVHGYLATISLEPWNFTNLVKKLEKTTELCELSWFLLNLGEICGFHGGVKNDRHVTDISKFLRKMNEQLLKV